MVPVLARTAWKMVAMVMVGATVAALVGCPFQTALAQPLASPPGDPCTRTPHATSALHCGQSGHCPVVTLPSVISLPPWELSTLYAPDRLALPTGCALPPFIPPRPAVCSHQLTAIEHPLGA